MKDSKENEKTKTPTVEKTITSVNQWTEIKTEILVLPSGAIAEVKKLDLIEEATAGHISVDLLNDTIEKAEDKSNKSKTNKFKQQDLTDMVELINRITVLTVVKPEISEEDVVKIPFQDRQFIFDYINKVPGSKKLKPFRKKRQSRKPH